MSRRAAGLGGGVALLGSGIAVAVGFLGGDVVLVFAVVAARGVCDRGRVWRRAGPDR